MKYTLTLAVLSGLFLAAPSIADDGHVSRSTLGDLGLGEMQTLSDAEGMSVRGMSGGFASAWGSSIVSAVLIDPHTKSFIAGADSNQAKSTSIGTHKNSAFAFQKNFSSVTFNLNIETDTSKFNGFLFGAAGGKSSALGN